LNEVKCQDLLIRASPRVQRFSEARLLLIGDGPLMMDCETWRPTWAWLIGYVSAGYQREPARYLQAMNIFA